MSRLSPYDAALPSPRLRGEGGLAISAFTRVFDALWRGRVRWDSYSRRKKLYPFIRLAASPLATFSPQAGRRKKRHQP
jgi:hypothetical protein